ncbi:MAG: hypothetical protein ACOYOT_00655 [Bacteroidales bacterium]
MKILIKIILTFILLTGCISTAKLSDFSNTSSKIDFDKLSREFKLTKTPFWTSKTSNEYYFEKDVWVVEPKLIETIKGSLEHYNYSILVSNIANQCLIGKRGMRSNEWSSITAVYYKILPNKVQVYIITKITQDFTGGWRENRAMEVGNLVENSIQ